MDVIMRQTLTDSINGGRTTQVFMVGGRYRVPDHIGQIWVGRGCATAASAAVGETSGKSEAAPVSPVPRVPPVSHPTRKE